MPDTTPSSTISWSVEEFEKKERHPDWQWYVGLIFGIAAIFAFFYHNMFFGIFLLVAGVVVIIYALRDPKTLTIVFVEKGITINGELIPYEKITRFWLDETGKTDKLLLRVQGSFIPTIVLPLAEVSADTVRASLKDKKVPEEEIQESNSAKLFDKIGF